jgi:ABC-type histidine transport system ATPase subunit
MEQYKWAPGPQLAVSQLHAITASEAMQGRVSPVVSFHLHARREMTMIVVTNEMRFAREVSE